MKEGSGAMARVSKVAICPTAALQTRDRASPQRKSAAGIVDYDILWMLWLGLEPKNDPYTAERVLLRPRAHPLFLNQGGFYCVKQGSILPVQGKENSPQRRPNQRNEYPVFKQSVVNKKNDKGEAVKQD